jgi:hypothetical protein
MAVGAHREGVRAGNVDPVRSHAGEVNGWRPRSA